MSISKPERHDQELKIFGLRHEAGVQAVRDWLYRERDEINMRWPAQTGEDLVRLQGEAKRVAQMIKVIDNESQFKRVEA
jgi:hypothetical protein